MGHSPSSKAGLGSEDNIGLSGHPASVNREIDLALPVNASLYNLGSVIDQLRSFLARASHLNWHPPFSLVIQLGPYNCGLVGEEF